MNIKTTAAPPPPPTATFIKSIRSLRERMEKKNKMFVIWSITYHDDVNWMVAKLLNTLKTCFNCDRRPNTHSASNENSHKILLFYVFCVWYKYIERFACSRVRVCMYARAKVFQFLFSSAVSHTHCQFKQLFNFCLSTLR